MRDSVMQRNVQPIFLGDVTTLSRTFKRSLFWSDRQQLLLEMDFGQVTKVLSHPLGLDGADLARVSSRRLVR